MPRKRKEPVDTFVVYVGKKTDSTGKVNVGQIGVRDASGKISHYRRFQYLDEIGSRIRKELVEREKKGTRKARSTVTEVKNVATNVATKTPAKGVGKKRGRKKGSGKKKSDTKKATTKKGTAKKGRKKAA